MSALEPRNSYPTADEVESLGSSANIGLSPSSVWAPDYDEEDEITPPDMRVDVHCIDLMSPNIELDGRVPDGPRPVQMLDESGVLPGEASYAAVVLNQPLEEHVPNPQHSSEPIPTRTVDDNREDKSASRVRLLDESQVLPGEASYASVVLNQPLEENVFKPQHSSEPIPSSSVDDRREDRSTSRVRILDESQVLPGEASFASVILNQPLEENVFKPQRSSELIPSSSVDDRREDRPTSRVRLLDESQVLDGEASFATAMSGERAKVHSPLTEFFAKTKLNLKQLVLATSALALVLALAVTVLVRLTSSQVVTVSSAPPPSAMDTASQTASTSIASPESVLISNSQGKVTGSVGPTEPEATVEETQSVAEAKLSEKPSSDASAKVPSIDAKPGAVRQEILREVTPVGARVSSPKERIAETKNGDARKAVKEPAVVKTPKAPARSEPLETRPEPPSTQSERPVTVEKVETKTAPTGGGGERPRTVTRKPMP